VKPINKKNFGPNGIQIQFHNGTAVVTGYVTRQISYIYFEATVDGVSKFKVRLADTSDVAAALTPGLATVKVAAADGSTDFVRRISGKIVHTVAGARASWSPNAGTPAVGAVRVFTIAVDGSAPVTSPGALNTLVFSPNLPNAASAWAIPILGRTAGSSISATSSDGTVLSIDTTGVIPLLRGTFASDKAGTSPTISVVETLGPSSKTTTLSPLIGAAFASPILLESFESLTGFTVNNAANQILELDTALPDQGSARLSIGGLGSTAGIIVRKTLPSQFDPSTFDLIVYGIKVNDKSRASSSANVQFGRSAVYSSVIQGDGIASARRGRFVDSVHVSELGANVPSGVGSVDIQLRPQMGAPYVSKLSYDALVVKAPKKAAFIMTFDDAGSGQYNNAFPYMRALGMKATVYIPSVVGSAGNAGVGRPGNLTWAMCREMDAAGWDMAQDILPDDNGATTVTSTQQLVDLMATQRATILSNGVSARALDHACWSLNSWQNDSATFLATGTVTTDGTNNIVLSAAMSRATDGTSTARNYQAAYIGVGYSVYGKGVPDGTTVTAVTDSTHFTASNPIPAGCTSLKFMDEGDQYYGDVLPNALKSAGFKTARTTEGAGKGFYTRFGFGDQAMRFPGQSLSNVTLASFKTMVDAAIVRGNTLPVYTHNVVDGGSGLAIDTALFKTCIDYVYSKAQAGLIDVMGITDLWARDGAATFPQS
jgi:hypothetical protein